MTFEGYVLAGGHSSRMGFDKARAPVSHSSVPLAVSVATALAGHCTAVRLVRRGEPDGLPWVWADGQPIGVIREADDAPRHPLNGWNTALSEASGPVVIAACDLPGLRSHHIQQLLAGARAPCSIAFDGSPQPLLAVVWPEYLARVRQAMARGVSMRRFTESAHRVSVPPEALINANTPDDLGDGPVERLLQTAPIAHTAALRVVSGELHRLRCRGVIDPAWPTDPTLLQGAIDLRFGVQ